MDEKVIIGIDFDDEALKKAFAAIKNDLGKTSKKIGDDLENEIAKGGKEGGAKAAKGVVPEFEKSAPKVKGAVKKPVSEGVTAGVKKGFSGIGSLVKGFLVANVITAGFRALTGAIRESVTNLRDFSRGIAEINSILPANAKITDDATNRLISFSSQFGTSAAEQAKGFYSVVSAGIKGTANQLTVLQAANKAAVAGLTDINTSAKALVSSVNAYAASGLSAEQASDSLFVAVREGQTTFEELALSVGRVAPLASATGVKFTELSGALSFITKSGVSTNEAVTGVRAILSGIIKPTEEATATAKKMGIEFNTNAIRTKGLAKFFEELKDATGGSEAQLAKLFPNVRALSAAINITRGDFGDFKRILDETTTSSGATSAAFEDIRKNIDFRIKTISQNFSNAFLIISKTINKVFGDAIFNSLDAFDDIGGAIVSIGQAILDFIIVPIDKLGSLFKAVFSVPALLLNSALIVVSRIFEGVVSFIGLLNKIPGLESTAFGKSIKDVDNFAKNLADNLTESNLEISSNIEEGFKELFDPSQVRLEGERFLTELRQGFEQASALRPLGEEEGTGSEEALKVPEGVGNSLTDIQNQTVTLGQLFKQLGTGFSATTEDIKKGSTGVSKAAIKIGQDMKRGIGNGAGQAFAAFGSALVNGTNAFDAFAKSFLGTLGQMMIQQGTMFILQGLGFNVIPGLQGSAGVLIGAGAGLAVAGGALSALAGGGGGAARTSGAATSTGGGGGGSSLGLDPNTEIADPEVERQAPGTNVSLTVQGDVFDSRDTSKRLATLLTEAFDDEDITINNGAFA